MPDQVRYIDGAMHLQGRGMNVEISGSAVDMILDCAMQDQIHQGDESFHILQMQTEFFLIGPFVHNAISAIEALSNDHPEIKHASRLVGALPWRYRQRGMLGLRLFPIPALARGAIDDLKALKLIETEHSNG